MLFQEFIEASQYEYKVPPHETEATLPLNNAIIAVAKYAADANADLATCQSEQPEIESCKAAIEVAGKCMEALSLLGEHIDKGLPFHSASRGFPPKGHLLIFDNDRTIDAAFLKAHDMPDFYVEETPPRSNVLFQIIAQADFLKKLIKESAERRALAPL